MANGIFGPQLGADLSAFDVTGNQMVSNPQDFYSLGNYGQQANNTGQFDFGLNPETFGAIGQGIGGLTSLAQIYGMFQNLGLQKKAFKFGREGTKRNFNASATAFNNEIQRREGASRAYAQQNAGDFGSLQQYGRVEKWT